MEIHQRENEKDGQVQFIQISLQLLKVQGLMPLEKIKRGNYPQEADRIMQIERFKSPCSLPKPPKCAYLKNHQVSERCHFAEAMCAPPSSRWRNAQDKRWGWHSIGEQSPKMCLWIYRAHGPIHPCVNPLCHHPVSLTEKGQIVAQKKRYPRRN
eukprot:bmy_09617T0